ncbi:MAG TPA: N-acetylmuramoyl-L-alanine amidase [bacterium]|nr:N-acetylmuramoyl-L-alanine amidase [bacterium]
MSYGLSYASFIGAKDGDNILLDEKKAPNSIKVVVIDPGHGGKDSGAKGRYFLKEKDVNLLVARRLKAHLEQYGFAVYMTRNADKTVSLEERSEFVNSIDADLFISIHTNAATDRRAHGIETFYLSDPANDGFLVNISEGDGYVKYSNFSDENSELGKLYLKLLDSASSEERSLSIQLADHIQHSLKAFSGGRDRGVKRARFFVLRKSLTPSVLVEVGFLSNYEEEMKLSQKVFRESVAQGIAQGILQFRNKMAGYDTSVGMRQPEEPRRQASE